MLMVIDDAEVYFPWTSFQRIDVGGVILLKDDSQRKREEAHS